MLRFVMPALGVALMLVAATLIAADVGAGNKGIPENRLIRVHDGVVFEAWPANERYYAHAAGTPKVPRGFHDELVASGFSSPTALRFLPDGSLFVAEKRGTLIHHRLGEASPGRIVVDVRSDVLNLHQMGMLGLAVDPEFAAEPYVYLLYTRDALIGGESPIYGMGTDDDPCPQLGDCPTSGRLVRIRLDPTDMSTAGPAEILVDDWCAQAGNHTVGTISFDATGALLAGGGDGADGSDPDYGQIGAPPNACGDPPGAAGEPVAPPTTQGGALRSQDLWLGDDPVGLSGTIIRVDRRTGDALPDNPLASAADPNARRIVAYGLRNPYRFVARPGTNEFWIADVGWNGYEEINVLVPSAGDVPPNYGWPCYEGPYPLREWEEMGLDACTDVYAHEVDLTFPAMSFAHAPRTRHRGCNVPGSALSGIQFYDGEMFPAAYRGALFFADVARQCIFVVQPGEDGVPDPRTARQFARSTFPVDMAVGPDGALYYVNVLHGELRRITYRV